MGEAKRNKRAILNSMLPGFPPGVDYRGVAVSGGFALKRNILIVPPDHMREENGAVEVLSEEGTWHAPGEGVRVVAEGTQLGYDAMDYVVGLYGVREEEGSVLAGPGQRAKQRMMQPICELARVPADKYLEAFEAHRAVQG